MNIDMADGLARYGGLVAAIIGLSWMIWQMSAKGESPGEDSDAYRQQWKFLGYSWGIFALPGVLSLVFMSLAQGKTGTRGIITSFLVGLVIPLFIASLESQASIKRSRHGSLHLARYASISLSALGISLLFMGIVTNFYGVGADDLWLGFVIGNSLGIVTLKLSATLILSKTYQIMTHRMESVFLLVNGAILATILAAHHFPRATRVNAYFPLFMLMGIFLAVLIATVPAMLKKEKEMMNTLPGILAIFLAVFMGISLFLVMRLNLRIDYNYPLIAGAITSVIFIVTLYGSGTSISGVDLSAGALCSLLLLGGLWFSFKWSLGLGMAVYVLGLLSVTSLLSAFAPIEPLLTDNKDSMKTPHQDRDVLALGLEEKEEAPTVEVAATYRPPLWAGIFLRAISLAGLAGMILVLFRVFIQKSPLLTLGIDITNGDTITALLAGVLLSLSFEGFNLKGSSVFRPQASGSIKDGILLFSFSVIVSVMVLLSSGIFFRLEGLGALILGLSIPAIIGVFTFFSQKVDRGLYRASLSPMWIATAAYANFLVYYKDVPDQLTRIHKQQLVVGMILLIIVVYFLAHYQNRGKDKVAKNPDPLANPPGTD